MKLKNLFKLGALALLVPTLAACSFLKKDDNVVISIADITYEVEDDGDILVTITYTDESKEPVTFIVPKGDVGQDGNSIVSIEPYIDPQTGATTITITFSDPDVEPVTFSVPSSKGIQAIYQTLDVDGNTVITIEFTDGTLSDPITVFKGSTGNGISSIEPTYNIDGSIELVITTTDGEEVKFTIPAPETGNGIDYIESGSKEGQYYLTIYYTDGNSQTVYFDKPAEWHNVQEKPKETEYAIGDYAFDTVHDVIYLKDEEGHWVVVVDFGTADTTYTVSFDLNATDAIFATGKDNYQIYNGQSFLSSQYSVPVAARPGYTFGGWSTSKTPNPTNGLFTDLTPVLCDMTLFAIWEN